MLWWRGCCGDGGVVVTGAIGKNEEMLWRGGVVVTSVIRKKQRERIGKMKDMRKHARVKG